jgi:hypothetical protein
MATNEFVVIDYLEEARSRVTEQFLGKTVFDKYIQLLIEGRTELQEVFKDLMQKRSLNTATGVQLDQIGEIVGQSRTLVNVQTMPAQTIILDDDTYRIFIKSKIAKNITRATPEDIMANANLIFDTTGSTLQGEGNAAYTLLIGRILTPTEQALLNYVIQEDGYVTRLIPKPAGVRVDYGSFIPDNFFGYQGAPNVKGYGDLDDPSIGGYYASLF